MKLDTATMAIILSTLALSITMWVIGLNVEQAAQIRRLEVSMRTMCTTQVALHHEQVCAEMSLPLVYPPSPFMFLAPDRG